MFGEMFIDVSEDVLTQRFKDFEIKIKCLDLENRKQISCTSRVIWLASVSLSNWFDDQGHKWLNPGQRVLEIGTGTGLLGIYLACKYR